MRRAQWWVLAVSLAVAPFAFAGGKVDAKCMKGCSDTMKSCVGKCAKGDKDCANACIKDFNGCTKGCGFEAPKK